MESRSREPAGTYVVSDIDELRALLDSKRVVILRMLAEESLTVKQLADRMGLVPASVHYHVKVLERSGLVALVEVKEKSGILEKYVKLKSRGLFAISIIFSLAVIVIVFWITFTDETIEYILSFNILFLLLAILPDPRLGDGQAARRHRHAGLRVTHLRIVAQIADEGDLLICHCEPP